MLWGGGGALWPFQEYFTYIKPMVHQSWAKTREPREKPPDQAELGFPTCDPSEAGTTAVRNPLVSSLATHLIILLSGILFLNK